MEVISISAADMEKGVDTRTAGHSPRKILRIVEISGFWKIIYSHRGIKPCKIFPYKILNMRSICSLFMMISTLILFTCRNFEKCICGNFNY